jgi:hypothetical protein
MLALIGQRLRPDASRPGVTRSGLDLLIGGPPVATQPPPLRPVSLRRARLVFAVDATASRAAAWETAKRVTDALFTALPDALDVALAAHGGSHLHTFTAFTSNAATLRDLAGNVQCKGGRTCLLDILRRVIALDDIGVLVYIGDDFEESEAEAQELAVALQQRGTRVIILHDADPAIPPPTAFVEIADRTAGAVLDFNAAAVPRLRELLQAIAALAVGGTELLAAQQATMPGARLLLEHLSGQRPPKRPRTEPRIPRS